MAEKRKLDDFEEDEEVAVLHWKDARAQLSQLKVVGCDRLGNGFGWVLKRLLNNKPFIVQGPPCEVVFAPAYKDPTKFGGVPDPKRKKDTWSITLKTNDLEFVKFCNTELKRVDLRHMFEVRSVWGGDSYNDPAELTATLTNMVALDKDTGEMSFRCDLTAGKDAAKPDLVLRDYVTEELLSDATLIGQHSHIVPILDLSDVFVGKSAKSKQWAKMPTAFVKELVSERRIDAKGIKLAKRDD